MRVGKRYPGIWLVILLGSLILFPAEGGSTESKPLGTGETTETRRALLIGINKYYALPSLEGSKNDIKIMTQVLTTRFAFAREHMQVLTDGAATRDAILHALRELVQKTKPGDVVYIHYSGHGSQVPDFNGDEYEDEWDETLVPVDGRTPGVPDITDDELDEILSQLQNESTIIVVDACHSGTITRGLEVRGRAVPPDTRLDLYRHVPGKTRGAISPKRMPYVLMTGAAAHEKALDTLVDGRYYGLFSYALWRTLGRIPTHASTREVFLQSRRELHTLKTKIGRLTIPSPQLEAPSERLEAPLIPPHSNRENGQGKINEGNRLSWIPVHGMDRNRVSLKDGAVLGARPGSVWGLYPPDERAFLPGKAQGYALVIDWQGENAIAEVSPEGTAVAEEARAVMIAAAPHSEGVRVLFRDVPKENRESLITTLQQEMEDIQIVSPGKFAEYVVDIKRDTVRVLSADGEEEVGMFERDQKNGGAGNLGAMLTRARAVNDLSGIENHASNIKLEARIVQTEQSGNPSIIRLMDPTFQIRKKGEPRSLKNSLQLEVRSDTNGYLTTVAINQTGEVNLIFPNPYQKPEFLTNGYMKGGKKIAIPDTLGTPNRAGFHWDIAEPRGMETLWVFLSNDRRVATRIRDYVQMFVKDQGSRSKRGSGQVPQSRQTFQGLRQELLQSLTGGNLPGSNLSGDPSSLRGHANPGKPGTPIPDWTVTRLDLVIE